MLVGLGTLISAQTKITKATAKALAQLIDYAVTTPGVSVCFHANDMNIWRGQVAPPHSAQQQRRPSRATRAGYSQHGITGDTPLIVPSAGIMHACNAVWQQHRARRICMPATQIIGGANYYCDAELCTHS